MSFAVKQIDLLLKSLFSSLSLIKKDRLLLVFMLIPFLVGLLLYAIVGKYVIVDLSEFLNKMLMPATDPSNNWWSKAGSFFITGVLSVLFYFILQWTFLMLVSLFASPLSEYVSERTEALLVGGPKRIEQKTLSWGARFKKIFFVLFNEGKKIFFLLFIYFVMFSSSLIPLLVPLALILTAAMASFQFLDYSWIRKEMTIRSSVKEFQRFFVIYSMAGALALGLIALPVVNFFAYPFLVVYFTVFRSKLLALEERRS